jgi:hypothetical protein
MELNKAPDKEFINRNVPGNKKINMHQIESHWNFLSIKFLFPAVSPLSPLPNLRPSLLLDIISRAVTIIKLAKDTESIIMKNLPKGVTPETPANRELDEVPDEIAFSIKNARVT